LYLNEAEKRGAAGDPQTGLGQNDIEPNRGFGKLFPCPLHPWRVRQGDHANGNSGAGDGPRAKCRGKLRSDFWLREGEAETQPRESEEFAEGTQHHDVLVANQLVAFL
jgi:hypothetical protein